jgi:hypothetical protein
MRRIIHAFDGAPATPADFANPNNWDILVQGFDNREASAGSNLAQHGPRCDPPGFPYSSSNSHPMTTRSNTVFQCNGHVMTSLGITGYGAVYMFPPAALDFSSGTAIFKWDMSTLRTAARDWVDFVIMPVDQRHIFAYNNIDQHIPPDNIHIQLAGGSNVFLVSQHVAGGSDVPISGDTNTSWNMVQAAQNPSLGEDAARRDTFQVELSSTHLRVCIIGNNTGQSYTYQGRQGFCWVDTNLPTPLSSSVWYNQAVVQLDHRD